MRISCPICHKGIEWEGNPSRPFCSERCRLTDLGAWIDEEYRVPAAESNPDEEPAAGHLEENGFTPRIF